MSIIEKNELDNHTTSLPSVLPTYLPELILSGDTLILKGICWLSAQHGGRDGEMDVAISFVDGHIKGRKVPQAEIAVGGAIAGVFVDLICT